ncbi:MAG: nuclear transport factor 2 family protein [Chloroflexi bacterium]|nr:nuclear transport factor 2 family protein [Chloroflexota bacterium]
MDKSEESDRRLRILEDIEAIKRVKARYWHCLDNKLWDELKEVFAENARQQYGDSHHDGQGIVPYLKDLLGEVTTSHIGYGPDIELTSESTAKGTWGLQDQLIWKSGRRMTGFAYYEDEYVKENNSWRIKRTSVVRTFEEWKHTERPAH